ncbi:hypothetical protein MLD38_006653 [Melastoma candidum]|uniref:Uncharacterized protein n=1 Tax=Melastoma candidum TaxID=119954 RepID=A0ACB9RRK3_9MYRT|nr:hypothetical protein MLD38_006653 [Melastoma candidum]
MESAARELSTTSTAAVVQNLAAAEDGSGFDVSVTSAMAKEALARFQSRKYGECLELLYQLLQKKEDDPKVLHNIAIAEFFRDDCSDPKKLLEALDKVKKKSVQLARSSLEQTQTANISGTKDITVSKGSSSSSQQLGVSSNSVVLFSDEFDVSVTTLNTAVVLFHLHEYRKALSLLEPLYNNIAPLDETVALHICLLILDAALACPDAKISADVLNYLEKAFGFSQSDSGNTVLQQSANLVEKSSAVSKSTLINDSSNLESSLVASSENSLSRTLSEETLDYETMLSTLDIGGQDASRTPCVPSSNDSSISTMGKSVSSVDFKVKFQLYKVQFLLLTGNLKAAKREVKGTMNTVHGRDSSTAFLLKAQLEYARGNFRKAMKLLMALGNRTEAGISGLFFNNLGCVYQQMRKYHSSSVLFAKALSSFSPFRKDKPLKLSSFSQDKSLYTIYNCGLQHLASGKPILAARCIQKAHPIFFNRPIFWFRLAECCIMAWEKGIISTGDASDRSAMKLYVIGKGKWRRIAVRNGLKDRYHEPAQEKELSPEEDGHLKLSLEFARVCLLNSLHLLNRSRSSSSEDSDLPPEPGIDGSESTGSNLRILTEEDNKSPAVGLGQVPANGDVKEQKGLGTCQEITNCSLSMYEDTLRRKMRVLTQAILTNQAFVELELENPMDALSHALSLLQLPECSKVHAYLGHVYAAEALCLLNRVDEAAAHLSVYLAGGKEVEMPYSEVDFEQCQTAKVFDSEELNVGPSTTYYFSLEDARFLQILMPEEARAALYVNLAVKSALEGEHELALQLITQALAALPTSREATLTAVYIDLMMGRAQEALSKLKLLTNARFLSYSFTMHGSTSS